MSNLQEINEALLVAFNLSSLERLVAYHLDIELEKVATGGNLKGIVFALTQWATRAGRLVELIEAARAESEHPAVQALSSSGDVFVAPSDGVTEAGEIVESGQFYKMLNDITRLDILLRGSGLGDGLVNTTNRKFEEVDKKLDDIEKVQTDLLDKLDDIETDIKRPSVSKGALDSIYIRMIVTIFITFALLSIAAGSYVAWMQ